jgi:soluble lytic murein transglycosylase-like protein
MSSKHPIPPRRRRRLAAFRLALGLAVLVALACIIDPGGGEPTPTATSESYYIIVTPAPSPHVWVRYPVALDDDLQQYITTEAEAREIDPALVMAICEIESGCDPSKLGDDGNAWGIMQIHPIYFLDEIEALGVTDLLDPYQNILLGLTYLQELYATGHVTAWVLMAYNGGQSYASNLAAQGVTSNYAKQVMERAEELTESAQIMTD